jgi:hypothetical protein
MLRSSFEECRRCLKDVEKASATVLVSPETTPKEFIVSAAPFPVQMYLSHRNMFSTLFQAVYAMLDIARDRRLLYGRINYLFRIWVTSADNLLDGEDALSLPISIPKDSRVMRQVVAIMSADRILARLLDEAVSDGTITREEVRIISDGTLQVLLPSAAEEASEEIAVKLRITQPLVAFAPDSPEH